ncbi:MAG: hypothetical protein AAF556_04550 [Pseudomonadota bacterium]
MSNLEGGNLEGRNLEERPTAEQLGQEAADRPFDGDWVQSRRAGNWAILAVLVGVGLMFYFITVIRIEEGAQARADAEAAASAEQAMIQATMGADRAGVDRLSGNAAQAALEALALEAANQAANEAARDATRDATTQLSETVDGRNVDGGEVADE